MKTLIKLAASYLAAFFSITGIYATNSDAKVTSLDTTIQNIDENTPLYLYSSIDIMHENDLFLYGHYSHSSHQSHYSHESHQSHYSHRSSF